MSKHARTVEGEHGAEKLPAVSIDSYNLEMRSAEGFVGDRASKRAFSAILDNWRECARKMDDDPLGDKPSPEISKKTLDQTLATGDPQAAGLIHGAIEDFAQEFKGVLRRFLRTDGWKHTERIVVGGGFRQSRIGEVAIGRASILLKAEGIGVDLIPIRHHPDEAGLIGGVQLVEPKQLDGYDAFLAVDIGGTNIRAGLVVLSGSKDYFAKAAVHKSELWRHADESPDRESAVRRLADTLEHLVARAKKDGLALAPLITIGCPGVIEADGRIDRGGQNLPGGNWEADGFRLPERLAGRIPELNGKPIQIVMHNDAVVQGLSEVPLMRDAKKWGVVTIGTGLGNASFSNRKAH